jgi:hypothetical protein
VLSLRNRNSKIEEAALLLPGTILRVA